MKKVLLILALLMMVGCLYFFSYQSAYVIQSPGTGPGYRLVVWGISLPYTPTTGRIFSGVYAPLIEYSASRTSEMVMSGTIRSLDLSKLELVLVGDSNLETMVRIPASMAGSLGTFSAGDKVECTYSLHPLRENPFGYFYQLKNIAHR